MAVTIARMSLLPFRVVGTKIPWTILAFIVVSFNSVHAAENVSCNISDPEEMFSSIRDHFIKTHGAINAQPVTTFLESGGDGVVFHQAATGDNKPIKIRIFETNGADLNSFQSKDELPVLSVEPAPDKLVTGYRPSDSVLTRFEIPEKTWPLWHYRTFLVVGCLDNQVTSWALIRARVSSGLMTGAACAVVALFAYFVAMSAVRRVRNEPSPLATKYPAFRGIRTIDFKQLFNPIHLTANAFHQASVQKLQVLLFSFLVGWMLLALVLSRAVLSDLSVTIVTLLGISGVGAAVAQGASSTKDRLGFENWVLLVKKGIFPINEVNPVGPRWRDLVITNREFDVYKLQMLIFTFAVAAALVVGGTSNLSTFTVPETLLGILGLSQVVYLGGILARPPSLGDLDTAIGDLRKAEQTARDAVTHNVDVDADGNLPTTLPTPDPNIPLELRKKTATKALQRYSQLADRVQLMVESTLEIVVDRRKLDPDLGEGRRVLGPEGGSGGVAFSIDTADEVLEIGAIRVWSGAFVDAIQIVYRHPTNTGIVIEGSKYGRGSSNPNEIELVKGEFITRVIGKVGDFVDSIVFQSNLQTFPRMGGSDGEREFDYRCEQGEEVIGFEGRFGDHIVALGVIIRPRR